MSILSTSLYGSSTSNGIGGLATGLDTDTLVNQMSAGTKNKINKAYQSKQKLLYRQEAYREISSKLVALTDKYFSFSTSSKTNILSPKFFESNTIKAVSNTASDYVKATGNAENIKNFSITNISSVATKTNFTSNKEISDHVFESSAFTQYTSSLAGETLSIEYGGKTYNLALDKDFGKGSETVTLQNVADQLNIQINKISDLNNGTIDNTVDNKLFYSVSGDGTKLIVTSTEGKTTKLTAASNDILTNLKMSVGQEAVSSAPVDINSLSLLSSDILKNINEYMTFDYNGVQKTIKLEAKVTVPTLDKTATEQIDLIDGTSLQRYLQYELDKTYGEGKVTVDFSSNKLAFTATGDTNVFGVSGISKELSYFTGIESGTYNRVNKNKTLDDTNLGLATNLAAIDVYKIKINGIDFSFNKTKSLNQIIDEINNNTDAGVTIYYSSITDTFTVKADETGTHKNVTISDTAGNLAEALFGKSVDGNIKSGEYLEYSEVDSKYYIFNSAETKIGVVDYNNINKKYTLNYDVDPDISDLDYIIDKGTDSTITYTLNGTTSTVNRSTTNFSIDGINIELNENALGKVSPSEPVTFDVTSNADEIVEKVKQFVTDYNEILSLINKKTTERPSKGYQPLTPEQEEEMEKDEIDKWTAEAKKGMLYGDSKINTVLRNLRSAVSSKTSVSSLTLSSIGIAPASYDTSGKLKFDEEKFKTQLAQNPEEVINLFTKEATETNGISGVAKQIQSILKANVGTFGGTGILIEEAGLADGLTADKNYLSKRMVDYDKAMTELKVDLANEKQRYYKKFTALEQTMNSLNSQSSWLTSMLGQ